MYLWKVKALTNDLKNDKVTEKEKFKYFLLLLVVDSFMHVTPAHHSLANYLLYANLIQAVTVALGLYVCYKANCQGDNKDFIGRFICLLVPTTIRITLLFVLVFLFSLLFLTFSTVESDIFLLLFIFASNAIQYFWIRSCIIDIAQTTTDIEN